MKTFIHHDGALGDALLSLPCIRAIRDDHGPVHLAGRPDVARFLKEAGAIDEASSSESGLYAPLYAGYSDARAQAFLRQFDRAFVFTVRHGSPVAASLRAVIPRTETVITIPPDGVRAPVAEFRLKQYGRGRADLSTTLNIPSLYKDKARDILIKAGYAGEPRPLIALHPGSGGRAKRWPLENYLGLTERLKRDHGAFVLIFSGHVEEPAMKEKVEDFVRGQEGTAHVADRDIATVAALLGRSGLYIGNDSGITHLAAAADCAVIALFGPTDPALWRPWGNKVQVISSDFLEEISVERVLETIPIVSPSPGPLPRGERGLPPLMGGI